jgi:hypothetical protein
MSLTTAARPNKAATLNHPAEHAPAPTRGVSDTPDEAGADVAADAALAEGPLPSQPVPEQLVNLIPNDHRYPATDPCTYLG